MTLDQHTELQYIACMLNYNWIGTKITALVKVSLTQSSAQKYFSMMLM
jgi:hypothetical protein